VPRLDATGTDRAGDLPMTIQFEIPPGIEAQLRSGELDPAERAKELLLVDLYRREQITHHQLAESLGLDRDATDGLLRRHGVELEISPEEFEAQLDALRGLRPR
jgi:predicted HTH domain antitoxin